MANQRLCIRRVRLPHHWKVFSGDAVNRQQVTKPGAMPGFFLSVQLNGRTSLGIVLTSLAYLFDINHGFGGRFTLMDKKRRKRRFLDKFTCKRSGTNLFVGVALLATAAATATAIIIVISRDGH